MQHMDEDKKYIGKWIFLIGVIILLIVIFVIDSTKIYPILKMFKELMLQISPVLLLVYFIMLLTNYFVDNKKLKKYMGEDAGFKGWIISIISGIISVGPVYMWYPLMKDLQSKGVKNKFLVTFLYNRGIKLQWLPMLILYFGLKYSLTLLFIMTIISIPQGIITEKLIELKNNPHNG
jgi:uncharacterized membrane protein YraQ (UPF0718 family)